MKLVDVLECLRESTTTGTENAGVRPHYIMGCALNRGNGGESKRGPAVYGAEDVVDLTVA